MTIENTETAKAIEAGKIIGSERPFEISGIQAVRVPPGFDLKLFPELQTAPRRTRALMKADTVEGFCDYVKNFAGDYTALFHRISAPIFLAIVDYHDPDQPQWCEHRVSLEMKTSEQFITWASLKSKPKDQMEFGEFIEQNAGDINHPPAASLLEQVLNFGQMTNVTFSSVRRLDNGQAQITYNEENKVTNRAELPTVITLGIPIFEGGPNYAIEALLRYRVREGNLRLWFEIKEIAKVRREAVQHVVDEVKVQLPDVATYAGDPEGLPAPRDAL